MINSRERLDINDFYDKKYENYKNISKNVIVLSTICMALFWITDCILCDGLSLITILPRLIPLIVAIPYILITNKHNRKTNTVLSYLMLYILGACAILATGVLPAQLFVSTAFSSIQLIYLVVGLSVPSREAYLYHSGLLVEIVLSYFVISNNYFIVVLAVQLLTYVGVNHIVHLFEKNFYSIYDNGIVQEKLMVHDELTGAYNRTKFKDLCKPKTNELEIGRAAILMIDIDYFKQINDNYGHDTGDKVLQNLVNILRICVRQTDYIVRWGGEEFVIILNNCAEVKALEIAERIREKINESSEAMCGHTVSIGIAMYIDGDYVETIKKADDALYRAKESGRNKVVNSSDLG